MSVHLILESLWTWISTTGVANLVLLISAILLLWQLYEVAKATRATIFQNIAAQMIEIDRFFFDHPELKPYFYEGAEGPTLAGSTRSRQIASAAEMVADFMENICDQVPHLRDAQTWRLWEAYMRDRLRSAPALRGYISSHPTWYSEELKALADSSAATEMAD